MYTPDQPDNIQWVMPFWLEKKSRKNSNFGEKQVLAIKYQSLETTYCQPSHQTYIMINLS